MEQEKIFQYTIALMMLAGWIVSYAAGVLPPNWDYATLVLIAALFGLPPIVGGIKKMAR
jgi:hypothetical protein